MNRKIFIGGGAMGGISVTDFKINKPDAGEYEIHSFECNPEQFDKLKYRHPDVNSYPIAIWTEDSTLPFYLGKPWGSSLMKNKTTGGVNPNNSVQVESIDMDTFMRDHFDKGDYIIFKLDIEGAEYEVLRHMINRGTFEYIDELWGEWHWPKIGLLESEHDALVDDLQAIGFELKPWEANTKNKRW
jgi:FkbM family methyltransferase